MSLLPRHITQHAADILDHFPVTVVQGARQVGKSTLASVLSASREALTLTLDDPQQRAAVDADPAAFVNQNPDGLMVIDEVQLRPELLRVIKASVDHHRRPGRFLLTGSADTLRLGGDTDSLAGRAATVRLRGLSQGELLGQRDDLVSRMVSASGPPRLRSTWTRSDYITAMARGGFPEVGVMPERLRGTWLDSYLQRILERDAVNLPGGSSPARMRSVARLLAANQSGELVKARVAQDAGIPAQSITAYLDGLTGVFLIDLLQPWTPNLTRREVGRPKALVSDSALALRLGGQRPSSLEPLTADVIGGFLEGFVVAELLKQQQWSEEEFDLFHYRDRNGIEVDIVIELGDGRVLGIEVKSSSTVKGEHFKGLQFLQEKLGDRFVGGVVMNTAAESFQYARGLWGLPISALWEGTAAD